MSASRLSLDRYRQLCRNLPLPTDEQKKMFAEFVSQAHSWYKHLPILPPGVAIRLFLDPSAGMQRTVDDNGMVSAERRDKTGFHYSWIATDKYRTRFGYLAYALEGGPSAVDASRDGVTEVPSDTTDYIFDPETRTLARLPAEIRVSGTAHITALVHPSGTDVLRVFTQSPELLVWPEESGGKKIADKIRSRLAYIYANGHEPLSPDDPRAEGKWDLRYMDYPLYELTVPERNRQIQGLVDAMDRVCALLRI